MNENNTTSPLDTNNNRTFPDETGYSVPGTYTDPEWEGYKELHNLSQKVGETFKSMFNPEDFAPVDLTYPQEPLDIRPIDLRRECKPQWNLVDFPSLEPLVRALEYGVSKHGKFSYRNFIPKDVLIDKLFRHLIEISRGNYIDEETGEHHIGGVLANAMFYSYHHKEPDKIEHNRLFGYKYGSVTPPNHNSYLLTKQAKIAAETANIRSLHNEGLSDIAIGAKLGLSERTVKRRRLGK